MFANRDFLSLSLIQSLFITVDSVHQSHGRASLCAYTVHCARILDVKSTLIMQSGCVNLHAEECVRECYRDSTVCAKCGVWMLGRLCKDKNIIFGPCPDLLAAQIIFHNQIAKT